MRVIEGTLKALIRLGIRLVPTRHLGWVANRVVGRIAAEFSDADAITALLRLDQKIYKLEGPASVRHGQGLHPKFRLTNYQGFFVSRVTPGERVLDVGCGKGKVAHDLASNGGVDVVAVDIDAGYIEHAKQHYAHARVTYIVGDVYRSVPDGPFDVVLLSNVLEHLTGRDTLLRHLQATVAPSRILIRVPLFERDWRVPLKKELGIEWRLDPTHETEYTVESFQGEMQSAGLVIRELEVRWGEIWAVVAVDTASGIST